MTAISRFDISIAKLRGRGRQTSDPPEGSRLRAHPCVLLTLVDRPPAVNVWAHDTNDIARSHLPLSGVIEVTFSREIRLSRARELTEDLGRVTVG
jgi:hypothetical protein